MSLSSALKKVSSSLISKLGQEITFNHESEKSFDPETGKHNTATSTFKLNCAVDEYSEDEINGTTTKNSDIKLTTEATDNVPAIGDTATIESVIYRVMNVTPVSTSGLPIIYEVQLRV